MPRIKKPIEPEGYWEAPETSGIITTDYSKFNWGDLIAEADKKPIKKKSTSPKKSEQSKLQQVALTELRKIRRLKYITKEEFELAKGKVESNKSIKITYHKPNAMDTFIYKRMKGGGISDSDDSSSDSSSDDLPNIKALTLTKEDFKTLPADELKHRYDMIKSYYDSYKRASLPVSPDLHDGYSTSYKKTKITKFIQKVFTKHPDILKVINGEESETEGQGLVGTSSATWTPRKPDYSKMLQHEKELSAGAPRGRGRPKKSDTIHIDINSHNARDGKYTMGDGIKGGALDIDDLVNLRSIMDQVAWDKSQKAPKNILEGIKPEDITKLMKTIEASKTTQQGSKESLETARKALKERLAIESKAPKRKTRVEEIKTKNEKDIEAYNKAYASKQKKHFKKGSVSAKEYMEHLRSLRKR